MRKLGTRNAIVAVEVSTLEEGFPFLEAKPRRRAELLLLEVARVEYAVSIPLYDKEVGKLLRVCSYDRIARVLTSPVQFCE